MMDPLSESPLKTALCQALYDSRHQDDNTRILVNNIQKGKGLSSTVERGYFEQKNDFFSCFS